MHRAPYGWHETTQHYVGDLIYGANDGILTTFAVVAGVSGGSLSPRAVLIVGVANLFADGLSMGVGNFKNGGREWQPKGAPEAVRVHDFPADSCGKAIPYGVYDMGRNEAWVSVGHDHDTPAFAVASIRHWWRQLGRRAYPTATELFITADAGGSNGYRAWKLELQRFADETRLRIHVSHFPPGTSKWNKIEHRLFCHSTENWRGTPLRTFETIVDRIGNTRTASGLRVHAQLDPGEYPTGLRVTKSQMDAIALLPDSFHGE